MEEDEEIFEIFFTENYLCDGDIDGDIDEEGNELLSFKRFERRVTPRTSVWMYNSRFFMEGENGEVVGELDFWNTGEVLLRDYEQDYPMEIYPTPIIWLYQFLKDRGWILFIEDEFRRQDPMLWLRVDSIISEDEKDESEVVEDDGGSMFHQKVRIPKCNKVNNDNYSEEELRQRESLERNRIL